MTAFEHATQLAAALRAMPCSCREPHLAWPSMKVEAAPYICRRCTELARWNEYVTTELGAVDAHTL